MSKREKLLQEEEKLQRSYLINYLADVISLHYKYFKNKKFDSFEQYLNGSKSFYLVDGKDEKIKLYKEIDDVLINRHELLCAHYILDKPVYLVSVAQERFEE